MKRILALTLLLGTLLLPTGCSFDDVKTAAQAGGREYGQNYELKQDEQMETAFFSLKVNSATLHDEFGGYTPTDDTHKFLVVNITIKNIFDGGTPEDSIIPMYNTDFVLRWDALGDGSIYAEDEFVEAGSTDEMLPNEYEMEAGESRTGNLVYEVPADETKFAFEYLEYYEDEFEGNTYSMSLAAEEA